MVSVELALDDGLTAASRMIAALIITVDIFQIGGVSCFFLFSFDANLCNFASLRPGRMAGHSRLRRGNGVCVWHGDGLPCCSQVHVSVRTFLPPHLFLNLAH